MITDMDYLPHNAPGIDNWLSQVYFFTLAFIQHHLLPIGIQVNGQQLSYQQLLYLLPLPVLGKAEGSLQDLQDNPGTTLPDATAVEPYEVQFVFTQENGLSQTLSADGQLYPITAFERLSYDNVSVTEMA